MALKRHRRMRANPVELLVVNPAPRAPRMMGHSPMRNPEWARSLGRGLYRGSRYAAESARDVYHGVREAHRARQGAAVPTTNPGRTKKKRNPTVALPKRDTKGRFKKKAQAKRARRAAKKSVAKKNPAPARRRRRHAAKKNPAPMRRRRRAAKKNPAPARRRRRHAAKKNPAPARRRHRAKRKNPTHAKRRAKRNPLSKRFQKRVSRTIASLKKRRKKAPARSIRRRALSAQVSRAGAILSLARSRSKAKTIRPAIRGLQRAMSVRSNPGFAGLMESAKILVPQALAGSVGLVGLAMAGKMLSDMIVQEEKDGVKSVRESFKKDGKITAVGTYMPAISTAGLSLVGYMIADKVAPKYKGAVLIGGMLGAVVQAVMASVDPTKPDSLAAQVKGALLPAPAAVAGIGEYTTVGAGIFHGLGEYTTVGSGIFHGLGEYTTIGTGADNATEFAADSLRGLDDASQFAPGEGGILSGGIFK